MESILQAILSRVTTREMTKITVIICSTAFIMLLSVFVFIIYSWLEVKKIEIPFVSFEAK